MTVTWPRSAEGATLPFAWNWRGRPLDVYGRWAWLMCSCSCMDMHVRQASKDQYQYLKAFTSGARRPSAQIAQALTVLSRSVEPSRIISTTTKLPRRRPGPAHVTMHRRHTPTTTTPPFKTDEAERHGRMPLMFQLRYIGLWTPTWSWMTPTPTSTPPPSSCMENVKRRPKTMTTAAESEVLRQAKSCGGN
jgi:hypothetical protein